MKTNDIWWLLFLKGIFLIVFGLIAIAWPSMSYRALAYIFAFYILISGMLNVIQSLMGIHYRRYWFLILILGLFEIGSGTLALNLPGLRFSGLSVLIGITLTVRGILEFITVFDKIFSPVNKTLLFIDSLLSSLAELIILGYSFTGNVTFAWILGLYALISGSTLVASSDIAKKEMSLK